MLFDVLVVTTVTVQTVLLLIKCRVIAMSKISTIASGFRCPLPLATVLGMSLIQVHMEDRRHVSPSK